MCPSNEERADFNQKISTQTKLWKLETIKILPKKLKNCRTRFPILYVDRLFFISANHHTFAREFVIEDSILTIHENIKRPKSMYVSLYFSANKMTGLVSSDNLIFIR